MLLLSRKIGESILIGQTPNVIRVKVVRSRNGIVKLGIEAPTDVPVVRLEIANKPKDTEQGSTDQPAS